MALVDKASAHVAIPSDLEIFEKKATDFTIQATYQERHNPISLFAPDAGDIQFEAAADTQDYMKPDEICISMEVEIERADGTPLPADERVAFENNAGHTIIKEMHVELGNQTIVSDMHYAYTAHKKATTNYSSEANNSHRTSVLFYKDTAGNMDAQYLTDARIETAVLAASQEWLQANAVPDGANAEATDLHRIRAGREGVKAVKGGLNKGIQKRGAFTAESRRVWMRIYPESDFFKIDKYIPNGLDLKIKLVRAKAAFCLHAHQQVGAPQRYRVNIYNPTLWITKAKVLPHVFVGQNQHMDVDPARYFLTRDVTKPIPIPIGTTSFTMDNVTTGQLPKRLICGFIRNDAFDGDYARNPFNYENLNVTQIAAFIQGISYPATPFKPVYTGNNPSYGREYESVFTALGINHGNRGIEISREDYPNGYCLYGFDLTPNMSAADTSVLRLKKSGNIRIEFQLGTATQVVYVCMVFTEYDHVIRIDGDRNVYVSYGL